MKPLLKHSKLPKCYEEGCFSFILNFGQSQAWLLFSKGCSFKNRVCCVADSRDFRQVILRTNTVLLSRANMFSEEQKLASINSPIIGEMNKVYL